MTLWTSRLAPASLHLEGRLRSAGASTLRLVRTRAAFAAALAAVLGLLGRNLLVGLDGFAIQDFDEARHGVSAYEMLQSGDLLVNTYRGAADYWNLKPPLSFWVIGGSYRLFGYDAFALRLPSVIATLLTVAVIAFAAHRLGGRIAAVVSALVLASSVQLIALHSGRTGDPDAVFILFMTLSVLCTLFASRSPALLVGSTLFFSLAFLTKSFHAILALLFIGLILVITRGRTRVTGRSVLLALLGFMPLAAWMAARASVDGVRFFRGMVLYDVLSRGSTVIEGHTGGPATYVQLLRADLGPWLLVGFGGALVALAALPPLHPRTLLEGDRGVLLGAGLWAAMVVGLFSVASSKLMWYVTPAVPLLALLVGVAVAAGLRRRSAAVGAVLLVAVVGAAYLTQADLRGARSLETASSEQSALLALDRRPDVAGRPIYLDPAAAVASTASSADTPTSVPDVWPQSLVLAAELGGALVPADGGVQGVLASTGRPLVLLEKGSATEASLESAGVLTTVTDTPTARIAAFARR